MNARTKNSSSKGKGSTEITNVDSEMLGGGRNFSGYKVFLTAIASMVLLWSSFPPAGLFWLAWFALIPLVWLVSAERLPQQRPYLQLWCAGTLYWMATLYFVPIPHPALWMGWFLLSAYLGVYLPFSVRVTRELVHRYNVPTLVAFPLVWTGAEWIRCNFISGFALACLSHTQYKMPVLIQVADLSGAYTLTMAIGFVNTGLAISWIPKMYANAKLGFRGGRIWGLATSATAFGLVVAYGNLQINRPELRPDGDKAAKIAIVQSSIDTLLRQLTIEEQDEHFAHYRDLTRSATQKWPDLDLILWPESGFPSPDLLSDFDSERTQEYFAASIKVIWHEVTGYPAIQNRPIPMLVGSTTHDPANKDMYNSALLIDESGQVNFRYFKNHRVLIGEYTPLADLIPALQDMSPVGRGLTAGSSFDAFEINDVRFAPSICFETTVPHLIRRQINSLSSQGKEPDVLVNLTNDGWFFGTSCLDLHLACNVFRAVEMRKPNLVCANTGFSAEIDSLGRLQQMGPRRDVTVLKAEVSTHRFDSVYRRLGDWLPTILGWGSCVLFLLSMRNRKSQIG